MRCVTALFNELLEKLFFLAFLPQYADPFPLMGDAFSVSTWVADLMNENYRTKVNEQLNRLYASKLVCVGEF